MSQPSETLIARVDQDLSRAACELVLASDGAAEAVHGLLSELVTALEASGIGTLAPMARLCREAVGLDAEHLSTRLAQIEATWNGWKAIQIAADHGAFEPSDFQVPELVSPPSIHPSPSVEESTATPEPAAAPPDDEELAMLMADTELAGMFIAEALDHLSSIEALVLRVETEPDDVKLLNDVFRPFHTIKGNAGALGVASIQELAHHVENLLDLARSGRHSMGAAEIDEIGRASCRERV